MVINYDLCFLFSNYHIGGHAKARPYAPAHFYISELNELNE